MRNKRYIEPLLNKPTNPYDPVITPDIDKNLNISWLKAEIKRVNEILRNKPDYHTYKQNKKYLERLERKLRKYEKK